MLTRTRAPARRRAVSTSPGRTGLSPVSTAQAGDTVWAQVERLWEEVSLRKEPKRRGDLSLEARSPASSQQVTAAHLEAGPCPRQPRRVERKVPRLWCGAGPAHPL